MFDTIVLVFELAGTVVFAVSGAMTGLKKGMDIFGVVILAVCTSVGGGIIRDLILGMTPPATFQDPIYAKVAVSTAVLAFIPAVRRVFAKNARLFDTLMLIVDSLGLGIFTVVGIQTAYAVSGDYSMFLLVFVGTITGVGGGVIRDVLSGSTPYIFVKHFYACASIIGAVICAGLWCHIGAVASMVSGSATIVVLRLCAAKYKWSLPKAKI